MAETDTQRLSDLREEATKHRMAIARGYSGHHDRSIQPSWHDIALMDARIAELEWERDLLREANERMMADLGENAAARDALEVRINELGNST